MQHAGAVAQAAVRDRHEAGAALVPADDEAERIHVGQRIDQPDIALAGHAENLIDIVRFQAFGQQAGNGAGHLDNVSSTHSNGRFTQRAGQRTSG